MRGEESISALRHRSMVEAMNNVEAAVPAQPGILECHPVADGIECVFRMHVADIRPIRRQCPALPGTVLADA